MSKAGNSIALIATFLFCTFSYSQTVELKWIGEKPLIKTGVSWGVPFEKGKVRKTQAFALSGTDDKEIPLQTWPLAFWPDGSVKWMGFAAVTDSQPRFNLNLIQNAKKYEGLTVSKTNEIIHVNTGVLICDINTKGNVLIKDLKMNNKILSENGRLICKLENRDRIAEQIIQYNDFQSEINEAVVEQSGPVRCVIKITGVHKSLTGNREFLPFTLRLYFYTGLQTIRIVHTFIFDGDPQKDFIKGLGIVFDVPFREQIQNRHVRFSGDNKGLWSEPVKPLIGRSPFTYNGDSSLPEKQVAGKRIPEITKSDSVAFHMFTNFPAWDSYRLTQLNEDAFTISKRANDQSSWLFANSGKQSSGLVLIGDVSGGLAVSLKNCWQSYPASLEINHARCDKAELAVWFWSKDAEAMDLRHYDTIPHDLDATYEDVQPGFSTPDGIARSSELTLFPFDKLPTKQETVDMADFGSLTHQLICTPEYLHAVKAFGTWSLPDRSNETKNWIENQLDSSIIYYQQAIKEHHWYGFWNYGDVMHTYDPIRHVWRYDIGGFAWDNTELAPGNWLWYSFLRTGNADIFRMAEAMTRHNSEVDCYHTGPFKGLGSRHNVSHWGCGAKEARIGQAAWKRQYYYLTTDERSGDLMHESLDAEKGACDFDPLRIAQPKEKYPYNAPARLRWGPDWLALAGNWMTEWERTGNTKYRDKILAGMESLSLLPNNLFTGPNGLGYDPETGKLTYDGDPNSTNKNHLATIMGGYEILLEMFDMIDYPPFRKTFTDYCKFYSMPGNDPERNDITENWGNINFQTPRLTAFAAKELNDDKLAERAWSEFLGGRRRKSSDDMSNQPNLYKSTIISSPEVLNPVHENPLVGTNGTAQWGLNAIFMLELIGDKIPETARVIKPVESNTLKLKQKIINADYDAFVNMVNFPWKTIFIDNFKEAWTKNWFLDGQRASLKKTKSGLLYAAGTTPATDTDHAVLWTKQSFSGDLKLEFDFMKKDTATKFVNILYLFAEGSGLGEYNRDISKWSNLRNVPAMKTYFEHMKAYHLSFSAFDNDNSDPAADYIRARCYRPECGNGLTGTEMKPDYLHTGMFRKDIPYHICVIRKGNDIFMQITGDGKEQLCHWKTNEFSVLNSGRIGLRLMGSRVSEFSNFKVFDLAETNKELNKRNEIQQHEIKKNKHVVFSDNFSDNSNKWDFRDDENFHLGIENGVLKIEKYFKNSQNNGCLWYRKDIAGFNSGKDFTISFDARFVSANDVYEAIDFQWGDVSENLFQLSICSNGQVKLEDFHKGKMPGWNSVCSTINLNLINEKEFNNIKICQIAKTCIVYINGKEVMNTPIDPIIGNGIGIQECLKVSWEMDNLVIRQIKKFRGM
jgi:hypothetical protein